MVVTELNCLNNLRSKIKCAIFLCASALFASNAFAGVLSEERTDVLGHLYTGGGISIAGPAVLVRKNIGSSLSVSGKYYIDMISSASIDIYSQASSTCDPCYREKRVEKNLSLEYMHDRTTYNFGYTTSDENDYHAKTYGVGVAQTFFGDLTTINFGASYGNDIVGRNGIHPDPDRIGVPDPSFKLPKERRSYSIGLSQILTKNLITGIEYQSSTDQCVDIQPDESCLSNPYRKIRYINAADSKGYSFQNEFYPNTHNTDAVGWRAMYHLPYKATVRLDARYFTDSWGIKAQNAEIRYAQTIFNNYLVEARYRVYSQTGSSFYNNLFPYRDSQKFMASDKEMSTFTSFNFGLGVTYTVPWHIPFVERSTANFYWDHMHFDYQDFRDYAGFMVRDDPKQKNPTYKLGAEPLYKLDADVFRFFVSFWY